MVFAGNVTSCAVTTLLVIAFGMLLEGSGRQDPVFSEAQSYERFMGRWSRGLAQHFVKKSCTENNLPAKTVSQEAMRLLMAYDWPGNVRQFENAIEFGATMSGLEREIRPEALPIDIRQVSIAAVVPPVAIPDEGIHFTSVVSQLERDLILRCLEKTGGNKRQAARLLNLSRTTFIDKLQRLNVAGAA